MSGRRSHEPLKVHERYSSQAVGPIGPLLLGPNRDGASSLQIYSFSEIIVCEYSPPSANWVRSWLRVSSPPEGPRFPKDSVKHILLSAWLCSVSGHGEEDTGWAVDEWKADAVPMRGDDHEHIQVSIRVAVGGKAARLNRIGYMWTAYVYQAREGVS